MADDPRMWSSLPFRNRNAWSDFVGRHYLFHIALQRQVFAVTGNSYTVPPIGDGNMSAEWLQAVQNVYVGAAKALGTPPPPDLQSYNLRDAGDFASWTFVVSETARQLRQVAGLV